VRLTIAGHSPAFVSLALALWWYLLRDISYVDSISET
jgi:hypothetical protein